MKIVGSIVKIQGERVALVAVQKDVLEFSSEADKYLDALAPAFEGANVILTVQEEGSVRYYGRPDLCEKLGQVPLDKIQWQEIDLDV